ncbi:MAG: hypothetical protein JRI56_07395 [Deltaproteobacteria bacterium]|nr:hypothetical protein [Deltaproteobacteria bacterium]
MAVYLVTSHYRKLLNYNKKDCLLDCLSKNELPWSMVSCFLYDTRSNAHLKNVSLDTFPSDIEPDYDILVYYNRNIDPVTTDCKPDKMIPSHKGEMATEYIYKIPGQTSFALKKLSSDECKQIVSNCVHEFLRDNFKNGARIVAGISGGGDSNALLYSFGCFRDSHIEIIPVLIKGIPEWDAGERRAREVASRYGLTLRVVEQSEVYEIIQIKNKTTSLGDLFCRYFADDDFEFFGTLIVRRVLAAIAAESKTQEICLGLNMEDLLSESFYCLCNDIPLLPFPRRQIGECFFNYPLWNVPKKILDGCFPKYSLENYEMRFPCHSYGRSLYYQVTARIQSWFPFLPEMMLRGFAGISVRDPAVGQYLFDKGLKLHLLKEPSSQLKERFLNMLQDES